MAYVSKLQIASGTYDIKDTEARESIDYFNTYLKNYITPQMYGAKADGATDDSVAFQSCLNAAKAGNLPIYLPTGIYLLKNTVSISEYNNLTLFGDYNPEYWQDHTGGAVINFSLGSTTSKNLFTISKCKYASLRNILFKNSDSADLHNLVYVDHSSNIYVDRCQFMNANNGLYLYYSGLETITNSFFSQCTSAALRGLYAGDGNIINNYFNTNNASNQTSDNGTGIALTYSNNTNIAFGKIEWNGVGIRINSSSGIEISNIQFDYNNVDHIIVYSEVGESYQHKAINILNNRFLGGCFNLNKAVVFSFGDGKACINMMNNTISYAGATAQDGDVSKGTAGPGMIIALNANANTARTSMIVLSNNIEYDMPTSNATMSFLEQSNVYFINNIGAAFASNLRYRDSGTATVHYYDTPALTES